MTPKSREPAVNEMHLRETPHRLELIARGGLADIYRGDPPDGSDTLTVKVLQKRHAERESVAQRWQSEYQILRVLPVGGFPQVVDAGRWQGREFLAYRYIEGESVLELLQRWSGGTRDVGAALTLTIDLLDRLASLHCRDIVHSDISPENIVWDGRHAHLIDFGCAQLATAAGCSRWIGKAYYLSPEQAQGNVWDRPSDIYQTGIVLYELLCGQRFNPAGDAAAARVWASRPRLPSMHRVPLTVRPVLHQMLSTDPAKRGDAAACRDRLREIGT